MIAAGMDHDLYPFSALPERAPLALPHGKRVAICPVVYVEDWTLSPPDGAHHDPRFGDPYGTFRPDYRTHSWREYGLRIGIFRLFDLFARHGMTATLAVNASVARRCPKLIETAVQRGWDIAAHGEYANAMITGAQTDAEICAHIDTCTRDVAAAAGRRPAGWIGQDFGESASTPQILAGLGYTWLADWPNDEQPYPMRTDPPILSIPVMSELDDVQLLWHRRVKTPAYPGLIREAHDVMHQDSRSGARVLVLGVHAWLFGMPHRIRYLDQTIAYLAQHRSNWHATLGQLAEWCTPETPQGTQT